jgi:hypothetical protein
MKKIICLLFLLTYHICGAQITLRHNVGNDIIRTSMYSCSNGELKWARTFVVEDFGINSGETFTILSGKIGLSEVSNFGITLRFNIYQIDNNFPNSFSASNLLGSSQIQQIPYLGGYPEIIEIQFLTPIVVPENVEKILVEVEVGEIYQLSSRYIFPGGTLLDNDFSWFKTGYGCGAPTYKTTQELGYLDARFYITVDGTANFVLSTENNENNFFNASPNPVKDLIEIISKTPIDKVEVYNLEGRLLFEEICKGLLSKKIDYSSFSPGLYHMKVFSSKKVNTLKVIKQ